MTIQEGKRGISLSNFWIWFKVLPVKIFRWWLCHLLKTVSFANEELSTYDVC